MAGGFVGVDVFFVVSGFVITQLLTAEISRTRRLSLVRFYGRRAQRIIPMAAIVIAATVAASYVRLGYVQAGRIALDGQYAAGFAANLHFAHIGTDYLGAQLAPSPLQHYWSLSVEEQFYFAWPVILWSAMRAFRGPNRRRSRLILVAMLMCASYAWSIVETRSNGVWAYFSPLTRADELMLGALAALGIGLAEALSGRIRLVLSLAGVALIVGAGLLFSSSTVFPGSLAAVPTVGCALLLVAGGNVHGSPTVVQRVLSWPPVAFIGDCSFSLYLWHWPILIIAAESTSHPLSAIVRFWLIVVAAALSVVTYLVIENPLRKSVVLKRTPVVSIGLGVVLTAAVFGFCIVELYSHPY